MVLTCLDMVQDPKVQEFTATRRPRLKEAGSLSNTEHIDMIRIE